MLFIAKFTITCPQVSDSRNQNLYRLTYNQLVRFARFCLAQLYCDEEFEILDYYNGEADVKIPKNLIYVYLSVEHFRSIASLSKLMEGCAEILSSFYGVDIDLKIVDELPFGCLYIHSEEYNPPEFLK